MNKHIKRYESVVLDPGAWLRQAEEFYFAAEELAPLITAESRAKNGEFLARSSGALKATLLLLAVATENALKSVKAKKGLIRVENGRIVASSLGGSGGHDLLVLAGEANIDLGEEEVRLLKQLSEIGKWAGRYQQPRTVEEFTKAEGSNPRQITLPTDLELVKGIIERVKAVVKCA